MKKLIILDRDGVINFDAPTSIRTVAEWIPIPGSLAAIAALNQNGYLVAVATNQSGIGRGYYTLETFLAIQEKMRSSLEQVNGYIDKITFCPHTPSDLCNCRKPAPGMLQEILTYFKINPLQEEVFFVGDSYSDLIAANNANCHPVLVTTGKGEQTLKQCSTLENQLIFKDLMIYTDLAAFVNSILKI